MKDKKIIKGALATAFVFGSLSGVTGCAITDKLKGEKGDIGLTPVVTIGNNGNWFVDGVDTGVKAQGEKGEDVNVPKYDITYDYQVIGAGGIYENFKTGQNVTSLEWVTDLPVPKEEYASDFDGWYIEGTDIRVEKYDFIGGNVTLVDKWKKYPIAPSGLYQNGQIAMSWEEIIETHPEAFTDQGDIKGSVYADQSAFKDLEGELVINASIAIGERAFSQCNGLTAIVISQASVSREAFINCDNVKSIFLTNSNFEKSVFDNCNRLENVVVLEGVREISESMFVSCYNLKSISMATGVEEIEKSAFLGTSITSIELPSSLKVIGESAFRNLPITEIILPIGLKTIGERAFEGTKISTIHIPASVTSIGARALSSSTLEKITVSQDNQNYSSPVGIMLDKELNTLVAFPAAIDDFGIGNPVRFTTTIASYAFYNCFNVFEVIVSEGAQFEENAFYNCEFKSVQFDVMVSESEIVDSHLLDLATSVYVKDGLVVDDLDYLNNNFTKQATSPVQGYSLWTRNS